MTKHFINSLPLVASTLGQKYGVKVIIGGDKAASNGTDIFLPSLPLDSSQEIVSLARGYLDHEAAHIRSTDMELIKAENLEPLEMNVFNIIEDWRIEKILGEKYPGCRQNFQWLIRHFFDKDALSLSPKLDLPNWILLTVRSWSVPEIMKRADDLAARIMINTPGILEQMQTILDELRTDCPNTGVAICHARKIVQVLKSIVESASEQKKGGLRKQAKQDNVEDQSVTPNNIQGDQGYSRASISILKSLLSKQEKDLPTSLDSMMEKSLTDKSANSTSGKLVVAHVTSTKTSRLSDQSILESRATTLALKGRLQSLLQALTLKNNRLGFQGKLATTAVHRLFLNNPKVFRQQENRVGLNTAVHLLIDTSGSMRHHIGLVSQTAYSLCEALSEINGINVAATTFPGTPARRSSNQEENGSTVAPLLTHGQHIHQKFQMKAHGNTPLGEALWWTLQVMFPLKEHRKIIIILTDGEPDSPENTKAAIAEAKHIGTEIYSLGLGSSAIKELLPSTSIVLNNLQDLPRSFFKLMGQAISHNQ